MGEQSTSVWTVDSDPVWTNQAEEKATQEANTISRAAIKSQLENVSQQPPVMAPRTRSQTARSRPPGPPGDNLDDQFQAISLRDDGEPRSVEKSSEISPTQERPEVREVHDTPRSRKIARTVDQGRREAALEADPNKGRCLITNLAGPAVQLCHLVSVATSDKKKIITQLEYVWEMGYNQLNVDTRYNMLYLRSDWHFLFDQNHWALVPEYHILQELYKIYLDDKRVTCNMEELFEEKQYRYYFLPTPTLQDPICRFAEVDNSHHETHLPPFPNFKSVESHVRPHFVIFNTGKKLDSLKALEISTLLKQRVPAAEDAFSMLLIIQTLYRAWTAVQVPAHFYNATGKPDRSNASSGAGQEDGRSQRGPPRREGLRSATRSQAQGSRASGGHFAGGQQRAFLPFQQSDDNDDDDSVTDDTVVDDDTDWIEYIHNWQKQGAGVVERLESDISDDACDEQLATYSKEHARTPPSPAAWEHWRPEWVEPNLGYLTEKDRARFSSNDWALFNNDVYLTRPNYP